MKKMGFALILCLIIFAISPGLAQEKPRLGVF